MARQQDRIQSLEEDNRELKRYGFVHWEKSGGGGGYGRGWVGGWGGGNGQNYQFVCWRSLPVCMTTLGDVPLVANHLQRCDFDAVLYHCLH